MHRLSLVACTAALALVATPCLAGQVVPLPYTCFIGFTSYTGGGIAGTPLNFGFVPDAATPLAEIAVSTGTITATVPPSGPVVVQLPVPTFTDGTSNPDRVFWCLSPSAVYLPANFPVDPPRIFLTYDGGASVALDQFIYTYNTANATFSVTAIAFREGAATPAGPTSWGSIKATFRR